MPPPQRKRPARKTARCGVGDGFPRPHPPHPQSVGSGPRPHARKDKWSGVGERPTPDAPDPGKRRPPWTPSCRPHSAQSQLPRARTVGSVAGPHARTPRTHSQWVVGPGCKPKRTSGWGWESAQPRRPHTQARGAPPWPHAPKDGRSGWESAQPRTPRQPAPPPGTLLPPPRRAEQARKSARGGVGDGSPRPHPPRKMSLNYAVDILMYSCRFCS